MYEDLLRAWREEVGSEDLSPLPEGFYKQVAELVAELRSHLKMMDMKTLKARIARRELENVERMIKGIFWARVRKILRALESKGTLEVEKLTPEEVELFRPMEASFSGLRKFLDDLLRGELRRPELAVEPLAQAPGEKKILVRLLAEVPAVVGADLKIHGPFRPGDVAFIPAENALDLIRKGMAVEVEIREGA